LPWFVALLLFRLEVAGFGAAFAGGDNGRYDESELTGEGVVKDALSLVWPTIAAGGSVNVDSVRLPFLPGRISVEGAGVGRVLGDIFESGCDMFCRNGICGPASAKSE
jgi:hypothetical protein